MSATLTTPAPVVTYASVITHEDHPGVSFVLPYNAEMVGGAQSSYGYAVPMVLVTADLTVEQVMAAALHVGGLFRLKKPLRRAVKVWARSLDQQRNPHRGPSDWTA